MKKVILIAVVLVVVVAAVAFFANDGSAKKDDELKTVEVARGSIVDKALAIGQIEPKYEIAVKSKVAGIVRKVYVEIGDKVRQGDPLFDVKPDPTPVEYANAKREVELYRVAFEQASREHERSKKLRDKQLISSQEYENNLMAYEDAELRLKLAQEKLALIESGSTEIADLTIDNVIKSPISGTVLSLLVEEGDPVVPLTSYQEGTELATLARMDNLVLKGTVDEIDVGKLNEGMPVEVEIGALPNEKLSGMLDKISPKARKSEGATLFDVEITFDETSKSFLRAGYSANADVIINKAEDILMIPERLVTFKDSVARVEVRDTVGNIEEREIQTGLSDGINIEVTEGL
ncbi:efflux RND transporter periplasmic adaptor subunit, partial [candidate division GN15 bacterium]|nr:efflux RND transporter periplasmic adaptor subunit [candidate division GN15 bacterium]